MFERFYYLSFKFNKQIGDYIFAKFIEATIVTLIITSGLFILGIRFSLILGLLAGITNIIPYVGPILGLIPAIVLGLVEYGIGSTFGAMMILYLVANAIDIAFVFPILVSKIVDIHPIIVIVSVIIGSKLFGIIGMVISIPCAAACKLIFIEFFNSIYLAQEK
jgi:putative permease